MVTAGPRMEPSLVEYLVRIDDGVVPIAEICRRVGVCAEERGFTRPSYECVRVFVHLARQLSAAAELPSPRSEIWSEVTARSAYWAAFDQLLRAVSGRE